MEQEGNASRNHMVRDAPPPDISDSVSRRMKAVLAAVSTWASLLPLGCVAPYRQPVLPPPPARWEERTEASNVLRYTIADVRCALISPKQARVSGTVLAEYEVQSFAENLQTGQRRDVRSEWRGAALSGVVVRSILGSETAPVGAGGRFSVDVIIPDHERMIFYQEGDTVPPNVRRDLMTVEVSQLRTPAGGTAAPQTLTRIPFYVTNTLVPEPAFDLTDSVRKVKETLTARMVLRFENRETRLPENPTVTVTLISTPSKERLLTHCLGLGYTKTQSGLLLDNMGVSWNSGYTFSDSGQMLVLDALVGAVYAVDARSAARQYSRLTFEVLSSGREEKIILLSQQSGAAAIDGNSPAGISKW